MPANIDPSFFQISPENQALMYHTTSPENQVAIAQGYERFITGGGTPGVLAPTPGAPAAAAAMVGSPSAITTAMSDPYNTYDSPTAGIVAPGTPAGEAVQSYEQTLGYVYWRGEMKRQTNITMSKIVQAWAPTKTPGEIGRALAKAMKSHPKGGYVLKTRTFLRELA